MSKPKPEVKQQEYAELTAAMLQEKFPNLAKEDIEFYLANERVLGVSVSIGMHKYNELIEKDKRYRLFNATNPNAKALKLTDLERNQILQFETEKIIRDREAEEREKDYIQGVRNGKKSYETIMGIRLTKGNLYKGFKDAFRLLSGHEFEENVDSLANLESVVKYFAKDETFFNCHCLVKEFGGGELVPSFDKGLLIIGNYGNCKTTIMKSFEMMINHNYKIAVEKKWDNVRDWADARFQIANCHDVVTEFEGKSTNDEKNIFFEKYNSFRFSFDDLKKEQISNNYGKKNIIQSILEKRYDNKKKTFGTMNFKEGYPNDIEHAMIELGEKYGGHIFDRSFQMFNIIHFQGKSFRK